MLRTFPKVLRCKTMTYSFLIQLYARIFKARLLLFINKPGISFASERYFFFTLFSYYRRKYRKPLVRITNNEYLVYGQCFFLNEVARAALEVRLCIYCKSSGGSRGGTRGRPPLFLYQTEARRAEKNFFGDRPPLISRSG